MARSHWLVKSEPSTYAWEQLSGPQVTLSQATSVVATFKVPELNGEGGAATFKVTVTDPDGLASSAEVTLQLSAPATGCSTAAGGSAGAWLPALGVLGLLLRRRRAA